MKYEFNLQFFGGLWGGGGYDFTQVPRRGEEPQELKNLRLGLYGKISPGLESFDTGLWDKAKGITNQSLDQQSSLLGQLPGALSQSNNALSNMTNLLSTGELPSGITDKLNAGVAKDLQGSMGTLLNGLGNRGVLNSSITSKGISQLGQQAADAYNKNYLNAFNSVLSGQASALQGSQNNTATLLSTLKQVASAPESAYAGVGAGLNSAYNLWKAWQNSYDNRTDYDTIATEKSSGCITGDTLVRLADGREVAVRELQDDEQIAAWDFETGKVTFAPLTAFFKRTGDAAVMRVRFEDGSNVGVIYEHLFFDLTTGKFVAVNADSQDYIGHEFARVGEDGKVEPVKVASIETDGRASEMYAPQCEGYLNFLANGFITGNDGQLGLCNCFEYDTESMRYDEQKKASDMERYGELAYGLLEDLVSREFFESNHGSELGVAIGKGLLTVKELREYLRKYSGSFIGR